MSECLKAETQALHKLISSGFTAYCSLRHIIAYFSFVGSKLTPSRLESLSEQIFFEVFSVPPGTCWIKYNW
jgi:hypothetical protein